MRVEAPEDQGRDCHVEQLRHVRNCGQDALRDFARTYDWDAQPETVLGWVMAQKGMDLETALAVFCNAIPLKYNYISKRDVPAAHRAACMLLDTIVMRINSGFYLPDAVLVWPEDPRVVAWMRYQHEDRTEGRVGRWVLDKQIVETAFASHKRPEPVVVEKPRRHFGGWASVLHFLGRPEGAQKRLGNDGPHRGES